MALRTNRAQRPRPGKRRRIRHTKHAHDQDPVDHTVEVGDAVDAHRGDKGADELAALELGLVELRRGQDQAEREGREHVEHEDAHGDDPRAEREDAARLRGLLDGEAEGFDAAVGEACADEDGEEAGEAVAEGVAAGGRGVG